MTTPAKHETWMRQALELAAQGQGHVEPNPMVGCVLVAQGQEIGAGLHRVFGGPHAERDAIANAIDRGNKSLLNGCTAYVTLEPCCHQGKTPPCTEALLAVGVAKLFVGAVDPFPQVAGQGIALLRQAGVGVQTGILEEECRQLIAPFTKKTVHQRPWVIAKWAMTLDGKIATATGSSQWISSPPSRRKVHQLRSRVDAIVVGIGTALADNPQLTPRDVQPLRHPLRVILDSTARLPLESLLVRSAAETPVLIWTGPDADLNRVASLREVGVQVEVCTASEPALRLDELLKFLATQRDVTNLLVEGGGQLLGSLLELQQIDECEVFVAPKLIGGAKAVSPIAGQGFDSMQEALELQVLETQSIGPDTWLRCRTRSSATAPDLPLPTSQDFPSQPRVLK